MVVHGGADTLLQERMEAQQEQVHHAPAKALEAAGHAVLAAIVVLEDSPPFNAGKGAVFTREGWHVLDASIPRACIEAGRPLPSC